jgi:hypothetical protein
MVIGPAASRAVHCKPSTKGVAEALAFKERVIVAARGD